MTSKEHKQLIQNFLDMVCLDTQGSGGDSEKLAELLQEYFEEEFLYE